MSKRLFLLLFLIQYSLLSYSQKQDTTAAKPEASQVDTFDTKHRANKAALYSAILPGLGQAYNHKYWKIPIIYGGFVGLGLAIQFNNEQYKIFKTAYKERVDGDSTTVDAYAEIYPDAQSLVVRRDYYRRSRDLMIIFTSILYVLNVVDAYVDAHLSDFDVSDNLSMRVTPVMQMNREMQPITSLSLCFSLR